VPAPVRRSLVRRRRPRARPRRVACRVAGTPDVRVPAPGLAGVLRAVPGVPGAVARPSPVQRALRTPGPALAGR
jgi:hypothetical protein